VNAVIDRGEDCLEKAAAMGFDGVEILHVQMKDASNVALQKIKHRAHSLGLALMGFSTHQGFVDPDEAARRNSIQKSLYEIDLACNSRLHGEPTYLRHGIAPGVWLTV
jgi:sugar phosphate isomerase/epimerase